jgi:hypothetical protein
VIVRAAPREHFEWLTSRAGTCIPSPDFRAIEAIDGDRILGMVGYDAWTPNGVSMSVAIDEPVAVRRLLGPAFSYPFLEAGRGVITAVVRGDNAASRKFCEHVGFRKTHAIRDGWAAGTDLLLYEMRRDECRHLRRQS